MQTKNSNITLENLTPQTKYIIRLVAIESFPESSDVTVLGPVFSSWISTLSTNYTPQPVSNISLKSLEFVQGKFQATIEWTPDKGKIIIGRYDSTLIHNYYTRSSVKITYIFYIK